MDFFKRAAKATKYTTLEKAIEAEDPSAVEALVKSGAKIKVQINSQATLDYRTVAELVYGQHPSDKAREISKFLNTAQHDRVKQKLEIPVHPRSPRASR